MAHQIEHKPFSKVEINRFPVGKFLSKRSFLAKDAVSREGADQAQKILSENKEGLSVFFAHLGLLDIFGTAAVMEDFADFKAVFPVAASWYFFPALRPIFDQLNKQVPHEFIPVFRKEELGRSAEGIQFLDFSHLDEKEKKEANQAYAQHAQDVLNAGGVVMLAPYGGRAPVREHLRSGPVSLLQQGGPIIFTLTVWNWKKMKYEVFFSKIHTFENDISKEQAHETIYKEFARMAKLSGITKKQMLESKSGSIISRNIWKFIAVLISTGILISGVNKLQKKRVSHKKLK